MLFPYWISSPTSHLMCIPPYRYFNQSLLLYPSYLYSKVQSGVILLSLPRSVVVSHTQPNQGYFPQGRLFDDQKSCTLLLTIMTYNAELLRVSLFSLSPTGHPNTGQENDSKYPIRYSLSHPQPRFSAELINSSSLSQSCTNDCPFIQAISL